MRRISSSRLFPTLWLGTFAIGCGGGSGGGPPLAAPSDLTAAPMGGGAHLIWKDNSGDEETFVLERKEGAAPFAELDRVPFDTTVYHDAAVNLGHTYSYRVRASQGSTTSAYSNEATAAIPGGSGGATGAGGASGTGGTSAAGMGGRPAGMGGTGTGIGAGGTNAADAGADARAPDGPTASAVSFRRDVVPSLAQSCGGTTSACHGRDQAVGRSMPQYGPCKVIWFSAVDEPEGATYYTGPNAGLRTGCPDLGLYDRLTQLHSMLCDAPTWSQRPTYVVPFDLQASLLYQVIAGDPSFGGSCSLNGLPVSRMPKVDPQALPNGAALTEEKIQKIRDWILQGAPNN